MSELFGADRTHNLFVLFDMAHILALAVTVYLLYMLVKVVLLRERARAMLADPRFLNGRFLLFLHLWLRYVKYFLLTSFIVLLLLFIFRRQ